MTDTTTRAGFSGFQVPTSGIVQTGGPLSPPDSRLDNLDAERGAILIGTTVEAVEAAARPEVRPFVRSALADRGAVERALAMVAHTRGGQQVQPTVEQRMARILDKAQRMAEATVRAEAHRKERKRAHYDPVIGREADDLPASRQPPWGGARIRISRDGMRAATVAWLAGADPDDVARATRWLVEHGIITAPEPEPKRRGIRSK